MTFTEFLATAFGAGSFGAGAIALLNGKQRVKVEETITVRALAVDALERAKKAEAASAACEEKHRVASERHVACEKRTQALWDEYQKLRADLEHMGTLPPRPTPPEVIEAFAETHAARHPGAEPAAPPPAFDEPDGEA